jgi:ribosomal protein L7/L12
MSTQYRNEMAASLEALGMSVNNLIQQGFEPIGGVTLIQVGDTINYIQTLFCKFPSKSNNDGDEMKEVRKLVAAGRKLEAVKLLKDLKDISLKDAKDIVDAME